MITDHTKSTEMVKQAAMADKITPKPPMLDAKQKKDLAALQAASGKTRDTLMSASRSWRTQQRRT
jgi:putative membrane protein